jgi:hypothetical protein
VRTGREEGDRFPARARGRAGEGGQRGPTAIVNLITTFLFFFTIFHTCWWANFYPVLRVSEVSRGPSPPVVL